MIYHNLPKIENSCLTNKKKSFTLLSIEKLEKDAMNHQLIKNRRKELKLTMRELGNMIGVGPKQIWAIEQGINGTTMERVPLLAKALQLSLEQLIEHNQN